MGVLLLPDDSGCRSYIVRHQIPGIHAADVLLVVWFLLARFPCRCTDTASVTFGLAIVLGGTWLSGLVQCCGLSRASYLWRRVVKRTANKRPGVDADWRLRTTQAER